MRPHYSLPGLIVGTVLLTLPGTPTAAENNTWQFEITPYLWAAGLDGDINTGGGTPVSSPVGNDYSFFVLENLEFAGFVAFEARKGRWRLLGEGVYVDYADTFDSGLLTTFLEVEGLIVEGAAGYQLPRNEQLELLAGGRFFSVKQQIDLTPGPTGSGSKDWADPFIGARVSFDLGNHWSASLRGDIGGFGISADEMYNATAFIAYRFNDVLSARFGYRYLYADFDRDLFSYDVSLSGFGLGLGMRF